MSGQLRTRSASTVDVQNSGQKCFIRNAKVNARFAVSLQSTMELMFKLGAEQILDWKKNFSHWQNETDTERKLITNEPFCLSNSDQNATPTCGVNIGAVRQRMPRKNRCDIYAKT